MYNINMLKVRYVCPVWQGEHVSVPTMGRLALFDKL